jgi:tetratricopeptide (TPR) repeat protein
MDLAKSLAAGRRAGGGNLPAGSATGWWPLLALLLAVGALTAAAHWPVLSSQAVGFDDEQFIEDNPLVRQPGLPSVGRFFAEILAPSTVRGYSMPLTMTSIMLDCAAGGRPEDLRAFHRTNLLLHVLNTLLVVLIVRALFGSTLIAGLTGLFFGFHPLTVEPVAWVAERKTVLATFFALIGLLGYLRHARRASRAAWALALGAYLLALLSKPTVIVLPLLFLLLDLWPLQRPLRRTWAEKIPFFALGVIFAAITLVSHARTAGIEVRAEGGLLERLGTLGYLHFFYLGRFFWPARLSSVYEIPDFAKGLGPAAWVSLLGGVALVTLLAISFRRTRAPLVGWLFFALAIAPTMGPVRYSWVAASDKYMYLPMLGLLFVAAWAMAGWERRAGALGAGEPGTVTRRSVLTGAMIAQAITHFRRAVELDPGHVRAYNNLGCLLAEEGRLEEAQSQFQSAIRLRPGDAEAHFNLGNVLFQQRRFPEAAAEYRRAVESRGHYARAYHGLGNALLALGEREEALENQKRAVALDPDLIPARAALGLVLIQSGEYDAARAHLEIVIRAQPDELRALGALAWILATHPRPRPGDAEEAVRLAERAAALSGGGQAGYLDVLAAAYAAAGRFGAAIEVGRRAAALAESTSPAMARTITERLVLYERGEPFRSQIR